MKSVVFGNPHTDWWELSLDAISVRERVVALNGELHAGFFIAETPMCVAPEVLSRFAADVRELDKNLAGCATFESSNESSKVSLKIAVNHLGHIHATGRYEINGNALAFSFASDQTQLGPLADWLDGVLQAYESKKT